MASSTPSGIGGGFTRSARVRFSVDRMAKPSVKTRPSPILARSTRVKTLRLPERVEPQVVRVEAGDAPCRQEQHEQQHGQDRRGRCGPGWRRAAPGAAVGGGKAGLTGSARGGRLPRVSDEEASAPPVCRGIPVPGRERLSGRHRAGQRVVLGVRAIGAGRVEDPAHGRARRQHGVRRATVGGADQVVAELVEAALPLPVGGPQSAGRLRGDRPPPPGSRARRARSGTTSSASTVSRQRSRTERATPSAACSSSPSTLDSAWAPASAAAHRWSSAASR